jgi:hypothetical protein
MQTTPIFVYNADEDYFSQVTDYLHKIFRPKTYACNLCSLTHSNFGMRSEFKDFIKSFDKLEFLHKDEFYRKFSDYKNDELPAVYIRNADENKLTILISRDEINKINNLDELITLIKTRINAEISDN